MSSSSFEFDCNSSSLSNDSLSMTKQLFDEPVEEDSLICTKMTHDVVQTIAVHVPIIVLTMSLNKNCPHRGSTPGKRYIRCDSKKCHDLIINNYFKGEQSKYIGEHFCHRFQKDIELFKRILQAIENYDDYFTQKVDASGKDWLTPLQKMIAAVQMLAYGCPTDLLDEYVQIGESIAIESLKRFCDIVIGVFEEQYLRKPNKDDIARLLKEGEDREFPSIIESLDCMHWHWKNCPTAWHGTHTNGFKRVPTLILGVVASKSLWIWHAFFSMVGTNNDVIVLDRSPLFDALINDVVPSCNFTIQGHH